MQSQEKIKLLFFYSNSFFNKNAAGGKFDRLLRLFLFYPEKTPLTVLGIPARSGDMAIS